ncbi:TetR/AcrR family transcriptional regulator [Nocardioides immobilis]|uniref:TetR/AcrR family transcriptional regulator n=2 Tax=Nocardioides immobilis TaxID=2049295 RepID=A0A417Y736_9ACTN|nr:TetR/AcrR family transcriptional regulator [Nocardioides immobilis]
MWRDYDKAGLDPILEAALQVFAAKGYHGTTIRELAAAAGLSVAGLYHHYASKQDILFALVTSVMTDLLERVEGALEDSPPDVGSRFARVVECMLHFHLFQREAAFVASTELRSLEGSHRQEYVAMRDRVQAAIETQIVAGLDAGEFSTPFPHEAARAVATLCVGVASWYQPDGEHSPAEVTRRHLELARRLVM